MKRVTRRGSQAVRQGWVALWACGKSISNQSLKKMTDFLWHGPLTLPLNISLTPCRIPTRTVSLPISQMRKQNLQSNTVSKGQDRGSNPDMSKVGLHGFLLAIGCNRHTGCKHNSSPVGFMVCWWSRQSRNLDNWNEAREQMLCRQVPQAPGGGRGRVTAQRAGGGECVAACRCLL